MSVKITAGLLPLYLKLYDEAAPEFLPQFTPFIDEIIRQFEMHGIVPCLAEVCRVEEQVRHAVQRFEEEGVDIVITLHLAYSPSLESAGVLAGTSLPVLMLDTTMDAKFGLDVDPVRIMFDHGIHGVQDLASVLRRRGKAFEIVAGHIAESDVITRAAGIVRAAHAAKRLRNMHVLRIGEPFYGMGDFHVAPPVLRESLRYHVDTISAQDLIKDIETVSENEVQEEITRDMRWFEVIAPPKVHERSVRVGLALRKRLERGGYDAFSMNFLAFDSPDGPLNTVPFLEASKAMSRGLGYAGEGDVLTAGLVGALSASFSGTTFTEIFCPDWAGDTLFLSHMGEINPAIASGRPRVIEKPFPYTPAQNPAVLACAIAPGSAVLVNLAPGPDDSFGLVASAVEVMPGDDAPGLKDAIRGWIRPANGVGPFLEAYSRAGGTHHSALVMDVSLETIRAFAAFAGMPCTVV